MVSFNEDDQAVGTQTVKDAVCPKCLKHLQSPTVLPAKTDRYDRTTREYLGFCFDCNLGFSVVQFAKDERWLIHKFQIYGYIGKVDSCCPMGKWQVLNELPEPAAVVTGPGGDYVQPFDPKTVELVETVLNALKAAASSIESLLKAAKAKHGRS